MGNQLYTLCCKSKPKSSYREMMEKRTQELNQADKDSQVQIRDYFKDFNMEDKFARYIENSNDVNLTKGYFSDKSHKVPYAFEHLIRIFYGALLWKNILYDQAKG